MVTHIVYKTTRKSTGEYYIGVHSSENINDMYFGSGDRIKNIISKYGKIDLERETLMECESRAEALQLEFELLTKNVLEDSLCLNVTVGGKGNPNGGHGISVAARQYLSELKMGQGKSELTKQRISMSKSGKPSPLKGTSRSADVRQKISLSRKGFAVTEETKRKLSEIGKGRRRSPETIAKIKATLKKRYKIISSTSDLVYLA